MTFVTLHILHALPLHNLNRDQSGQPKSLFDGGVQRGRLSSQALKRAARVAYAGTHTGRSIRTRDAVSVALAEAVDYAQSNGLPFDEKKGRAAIKKVIDGLAKNAKDAKGADDDSDGDASGDEAALGDNILFFARQELTTLAHAAVHAQQEDTDADLKRNVFIQDAASPSLDVAAFGRMFAADTAAGTHAAIAVSHAATTHQMALTPDYFSAVEEATQGHSGAAHIGMTYYTTGVYYRSFTIDTDQLARSWSGVRADGARDDLTDLVTALIRSLPTGRLTNSNAHTTPSLVLAEVQRCRTAYGFETPVTTQDGGYLTPSVHALAEQRALAASFDPANNPRSILWGSTHGADFGDVTQAANVTAIANFAADEVFKAL